VIKHIVMWNLRGDDAETRACHIALLKAEFESLRGRVPGLLCLEVGVDESRIDYACDVVLYTEFASREALAAYATHPEHLRVRAALGDLRIARHQVDYEVDHEVNTEIEVAATDRALPPAGVVGPAASPSQPGDKHHVQTL
jgi:hypothetical protein